jgi:hypothetical protein
MTSLCCSSVGSVTRVSIRAVTVGSVLEEEVFVVADVLPLDDAEPEVVAGDTGSAAITSASMSSKSSSAV